jgi:hypothetical protein
MTAQLKSHSQGQTLVLTIANPEHRNALDPAMYSAGVEALNVAETNPDVQSVVITGEGKHFCAGGNLNRILHNRDLAPNSNPWASMRCTAGLKPYEPFPNPSLRPSKVQLQALGFPWCWRVTWWSHRLTACLSWPIPQWVCRPMVAAVGF